MSRRAPYLWSLGVHAAVFGVLLMWASWGPRRVLVPGVDIVFPPADAGRETAPAGQKAATPEVTPSPPEPEPEPAPPPEAEPEPAPARDTTRPQPEQVSPEPPEPEGSVAPSPDIPSPRGARPQPDVTPPSPPPAPQPAPDTGSGSGIGVEAGVLGAHAPWYLTRLRDEIAAAWRPPATVGKRGAVQVRVRFLVDPRGQVKDVRIVEGSDHALYDRAALRSVFNAAPFPPLPEDIGPETIEIVLTFKQRY